MRTRYANSSRHVNPSVLLVKRAFSAEVPKQPADAPAETADNVSVSTQPKDEPSPMPAPPPDQPRWVAMMNDAIERFPMEMIVLYVASDVSLIFFAYNVIDALGYAGNADLAMALMLNRILRRPRMPLDLGMAALLSKAYPPLSQVNVTRLFSRSAAPAPADGTRLSTKDRLIAATKEIADKYGIAYLVSKRTIVGLGSTLAIYAALRAGVDVQGWIASWGFDLAAASGQVAGRYAAAMCVSALLFPGGILGAGFLAGRVIGPWRLRMAAAAKAKQAPKP